MTVTEFEKLKMELSNAEKEVSHNEGVLSSLMEQLYTKFQVKTLKEATTLLSNLEQESGKYSAELQRLFTEIETVTKANP